ncbi:hypothetical protein, partial [Acinetobacter baumannii]|uniref:hypothetical protein n=1 Tax=Acinetobacter baumannii TaxID=470 RepID=UPI001C078B3E
KLVHLYDVEVRIVNVTRSWFENLPQSLLLQPESDCFFALSGFFSQQLNCLVSSPQVFGFIVDVSKLFSHLL